MTFIPLLVTVDNDDETRTRILTRIYLMIALFIVSFFAVSFPAVARSRRNLRVPSFLFFVGKHFGTGVILATAFAHLLQDAFAALMSEKVKERWGIGKWTGLIVLSSLLSIFLVEYISTSFVDRLHSYSSEPPSPLSTSPPHSPKPSSPCLAARTHLPSPPPDGLADPSPAIMVQNLERLVYAPDNISQQECSSANSPPTVTEHTPMSSAAASSQRRPSSYSTFPAPSNHLDHVRTPRFSPHAHFHSHSHLPLGRGDGGDGADDEIFAGGHHRHEERTAHSRHHSHQYWEAWRTWLGLRQGGEGGVDEEAEAEAAAAAAAERGREAERAHKKVAAHEPSHAHLDLEDGYLSDGADEGGALSTLVEDEIGDREEAEKVRVGRRRQIVGILMLQVGIMLHSLVIGLTLAITSGPEFTSLVIAIAFHQLFEGLSLGIRIAGLPDSGAATSLFSRALKPTLTLAFALTTPIGIALGLGIFAPGTAGGDEAHLLLVQGLMSALSAGMLIYAACVEMLAGDFVMDPRLWRASVLRQALALCSLFLGVGAMVVVG
ncbi:Zinc/iron permease [Sparassis latifolia]